MTKTLTFTLDTGNGTGDVVIALRDDLAPGHVQRITELAQAGFYDGVVFHHPTDVAPFTGQIWVVRKMGEIALAPACQIVDDADRISPIQQQVHHMAADETGATGDHGNVLGCH